MMQWRHWGLALLLVLAVTGCAGKDRPQALTDAEIQQVLDRDTSNAQAVIGN